MGIFNLFNSKPSPEKFAKIMMKAVAASGIEEAIRYDAAEFRLVIGDGQHILNLDNAFRDYCAAPKGERAQVAARYLHGLRPEDMPATFADARARLMPMLRSRSLGEYMALTWEHDRDEPSPSASVPFSADTQVMLAFDSEHSIQTVPDSALAGWDVSFDEALAAARDNLRDITVSRFDEFVPGLFVSAWYDAYDVSRILFPDVIYQLGLGGEPVVMIPCRGRLLVASSNDNGALMGMLALAEKLVLDEGRPVSALMYRYENGKPVEYEPADPEVNVKLASLRCHFLAEDYASQKQMLEKIHDKNATDIFVATFQVMQKKESGLLFSYGVWTEGVDTLLPETDYVALGIGIDDSVPNVTKLVTWDSLVRVSNELEKVPGRYPARYRTGRFPAKEQIDALPQVEM